MTEILTESFCERCGTRYTFESAAPRKSRLARVKTLSKGVRNFVMSDDASLSEALAVARSEEEMAATAYQLDAFHQTFNFCLTCRQYTCSDCWNGPEGRCLTCAPLPGQEEPAALIDLAPPIELEPSNSQASPTGAPIEAWPGVDLTSASDIEAAAEASLSAMTAPPEAPEPVDLTPFDHAAAVSPVDARPGTAPGPLPEAVESGAAVDGTAVTEPSEATELSAAAVAEPEIALPPARRLAGVAPGQSLDDAIAAYEALLAADEAEVAEAIAARAEVAAAGQGVPEPPALEAPGPEPEPAEPVAAEPVAAEPPAAAEPVAAEPPAAGPAALPGVDRVTQPTWPTPVTPAAPAVPASPQDRPPAAPPPANPWLRVAPDDAAGQPSAAPQWPTPSSRSDTPVTLAGRTLLPQSDASALWAASAREVLGAAPAQAASMAAASAQPCLNCGLSLSANARFCRRCGSRQG